jgi:hypothetical protein
MAVILGGMTTVIIDTQDSGFQSINWDINRQPNRLWQLGSWDPWRTQIGTVVTVSVTSYAEAISPVELIPSTSCEDSTAVKDIYINAEACSSSGVVIDYSGMYLTSYGYNKQDPAGFGTESWSFQAWVGTTLSGLFIPIPAPTYVLQGRAEGNRSGNIGNGTTDLGIRFLGEGGPGSIGYDEHVVIGERGSVSAGFPGIGEADETEIGLVNRVGGGLLESGGRTGQSQASIPHVPLYLG